jgi:hypothetical protein
MVRRVVVVIGAAAAFAASVAALLQYFDIVPRPQRPAFTRALRTLDDSAKLHEFLERHQKSRVRLDITVVPRPEGVGRYDHWLEIGGDHRVGEPLRVSVALPDELTLDLSIRGDSYRFERVGVERLDGKRGGVDAMRIEGLFVVGPVQHLGQSYFGAQLSALDEDAP